MYVWFYVSLQFLFFWNKTALYKKVKKKSKTFNIFVVLYVSQYGKKLEASKAE